MRRDLFFGPLQDRISRCFILLAMLLSVGVWGQSISMSATGSNTQNFNSLPTTGSIAWSDNSTISAWYSSYNGNSVTANAGASSGAGLYSYGTGTNADRALGSINTNSTGSISYGVQLQNNTGSTMTSMAIAYTGEQWRKDNNATPDQILFYYRIYSTAQNSIDNVSTGWNAVTSLNFTAPITGATTATTLDGNATANRVVISSVTIPSLSLPAGSFIVFKWIDQNVSGTDHGVGIDDVTINWTAVPAGKTVTFNNNGGTGTMANQTASTATNLTTNTFTRTGYNFINWNTAADASGAFYNNGASYPFSADATMYAQWKGNVTYDANGGSGTVTDSNDYLPNAPVTTQVNAYTYPGFTFAGWNTQADGLGTNYAASTASAFNFNGNITLYAKWTSTATVDFWNLQYPGSTSISEGGTSENIYAQAYKAGATGSSGPLTGLQVWIGYSSTNNNPNSTGWTWVSAPYFGVAGNNDEFKTNLGAGLTPGTYYYASRFQLNGGTFTYGGYKNNSPSTTNGGVWDGTNNVNGVLTVNSNVAQSGQVYPPSGGPIVVGSPFMTYIQFYKPSFTETAGQGTPIPTVEIGYNSSDNNAVSGTGWTWLPASFDTQVGNNDQYKLDIGTARAAGKYYYAARIKMQGSTEYKYFGTSSFAYWNNDNGTFTVTAPPVITSSLTKSSVYGAADTYTITASGTSPITYNATGLPTGLSVNTGTGVISGIPTSNVGSYNVSISATNDGGTDTKTLVWTITQKPLTITGLTGVNKIYDGTTSATLSGTPALNTIVSGDDVSVSGTPIPNFTSKTVGNTKPITVTGYTLSGTKAGNYTISQPTGITANITAKALIVTGATVQNKVYDATTTATITGATLVGVISGDAVTVSGGGTFADANAGTGKAVTANLSISGADVANYTLTQPTGLSADITKANPVFTTSSINVTVGGTYALPGANITSTSNGTLSFSMTDNAAATLTGGNTINGIAAGTNTLTVNQAASTNYNAVSTTVSVVVSTFSNGDYRTVGSGSWTAANVSLWETYSGGNWSTPATVPTNDTTHNFYINNTITLSGTNTTKNIIINNNGVLNTSTTTPTFSNILVKSGGTFNKEGNSVTVNGVFEVEDGGTFTFKHTDNTKPRSSTIWAGTEKFHPNSVFKILTVDSSTMTVVQAINDISTYTENGVTACFGNVIIDCSVGKMNLVPAGFNLQLTAKDLIFRTNSDTTPLSTGDITTTIGGNLIIENTYSVNPINFASTASTININVKGDFIHNGTKAFRPTTNLGANSTFTIEGNLSLTNGGSFIMNGGSGALTGTSIVNLKGNLTVSSTSIINSIATGNNNFNFTNSAIQTIDVANAATANNIAFNVNSGSYTKLITQNFSLGTNSSFTVKNGGTLDFGFNGNTALNLIANGTGQAFSAASGSTLKITSPLGITSGAIPDYTGNVQIGATAANRVFNAGATYHYVGKSVTPQVTGNAIATSVSPLTGKIIVDMESAVGQFAASASKTINAPGTLEIKTGVVTDDSSNGFIGTGNLIMTSANGKYVTSRTGTQPELSGTYTLTNGTVEFANSQATAASIRVTPEYYNINVSGSNVQSGGKNLVVNNLLKVNSASGVFTVPDELDTANPYVVTAKKGIQVVAGGKALFKNNANLIQDVGAANNGNIVAQRIAKIKFVSVAKADYNYWSSPVKDQKLLYNGATPLVTSFSPGTPNNRIFEYKESTDTFVATTNPNFVAGKGYAVRAENAQNGSTYTADGTAKIFEFLGEPNNGDISTPSLTWKDANHGYNVIGNPYPSNINFDSFWSANQSRMYSTAYFWTNNQYTPNQQGSGYTGSNYAIYNGTGGNSAAYQVTSGSPVVPNEYIKPGQGFIVQTKSAGVLNFNNSMREVGVSPFFNNKTNSSKNRFWLSFTSPSSIVNDILVGYIQGASNGFEKDFDAPLLVEGSDSFFSILGAQKLAIQGKNALFTMDDVVPVGTKYFENGIYKIALSQKEGLFESQNIYLKDKLLNKAINLSSGDYTFTAVKGTDVTRFEIVYKDEAVLGTDATTKSDFTVYKDGSDYVIKSSKILGKVEVYDTAGRMVVSKKTTENNIRLNAATLTNGVYIIKAENSGDVRTKKVIK